MDLNQAPSARVGILGTRLAEMLYHAGEDNLTTAEALVRFAVAMGIAGDEAEREAIAGMLRYAADFAEDLP